MIIDDNNLYRTTLLSSDGTNREFIGKLCRKWNGELSNGKMVYEYYIDCCGMHVPILDMNKIEKVVKE